MNIFLFPGTWNILHISEKFYSVYRFFFVMTMFDRHFYTFSLQCSIQNHFLHDTVGGCINFVNKVINLSIVKTEETTRRKLNGDMVSGVL